MLKTPPKTRAPLKGKESEAAQGADISPPGPLTGKFSYAESDSEQCFPWILEIRGAEILRGFSRRKAVREYEIRILSNDGAPSLIIAQAHFSDEAAIQAARRMSLGKQFEVWREMECITGFARLLRPRNSAAPRLEANAPSN